MADENFKPFVPEETDLKEFTFGAVFLGVVMAVILGAANAYLGLKAGMTVAATFPAAVVSMAVLRVFGGSILQENLARTIGSVGEALVAGAIFTIPAFVIAGVWKEFATWPHYFEATAVMLVGGVVGVLFVTILRRIMIVETDLPFPESVAAAEIHKAGRTGGTGAKYLFGAMISGALIQFAVKIKLFAAGWEKFIPFSKSAIKFVTKTNAPAAKVAGGGGMVVASPAVSPAYVGVGYIIGPRLSAIAFSGGLLAWTLFVPLLLYFVGPNLWNTELGKTVSDTKIATLDGKYKKDLKDGNISPELYKVLKEKKANTFYFSIDKSYADVLAKGKITAELAELFKTRGYNLPLKSQVKALEPSKKWLINDGEKENKIEYTAQIEKITIEKEGKKEEKEALLVYSNNLSTEDFGWIIEDKDKNLKYLAVANEDKVLVHNGVTEVVLFDTEIEYKKELLKNSISKDFYALFEKNGNSLSKNIVVSPAKWVITDKNSGKGYVVEADKKEKEKWQLAPKFKISEGFLIASVWKFIVRPIAVGGMLIGAIFTLYKMRKELFTGLKRAIGDITKVAQSDGSDDTGRLDKDLSFKWIFIAVGIGVLFMAVLYWYFCRSVGGAIMSTAVMAVAGFFFAAVAGYLVGLIGSSNNPISGLTLSTLIISALLMVAVGVEGASGIAAVLGVAAVVCCICGVAGDMLQDLKVGHILGGTPWKMELGEIIGVIAAALVMFGPLALLHLGNIAEGGQGFGDKALPAPQAGLMAMLAKGIVGGEMAWALVIIGMFMSVGLIMVGAPSPMLIAVGMYLPLETTFTIFVGGIIRWILDFIVEKRKFSEIKKSTVENTGILLASGFIAGEALMGLIVAAFAFAKIPIPKIFASPSIFIGMGVLVAYAFTMIAVPLSSAKKVEEQPA